MIKAVITDIEGTTTSVSFVYEVLFPYFRTHLTDLVTLADQPTVKRCFDEVRHALTPDGTAPTATDSEVIDQLRIWSEQDRKDTCLKTLQGLLWKEGYESGKITGHLYPDVVPALEKWHQQNLTLGVYSSGSVAAQKLLFGFSDFGDLTPMFGHYFDTTIGRKQEAQSYTNIATTLQLDPASILFLSDVTPELDAAQAAGFRALQVVREGTTTSQNHPFVESFHFIEPKNYD